MHQLADDGVHRPVELLQVLRRARELGNAVESGLHLLRATALRLGELRRDAGAGCHSGSIPAPEARRVRGHRRDFPMRKRFRVTMRSIVRHGEPV